MPKGSFGGGGGGGFRSSSGGSGFRGGSSSFRPSSFSSGGSAFGRTGASRVSTSSYRPSTTPSRPTYHTSYNPYRSPYHRPYGYGYGSGWGWGRPWYGRSWMWGSWHRPWYYSPVYVGGGFVLFIILLLILLPLMGLMIAYPFGSSNANMNGDVSYRSTETLNFNEYWYEKEPLKTNGIISFNVQSTGVPVTFVISDKQFSSFPSTKNTTKTVSRTGTNAVTIDSETYVYETMFLAAGSKITYSYNVTNGVEFLLADGDNAINWNNYESYTAIKNEFNKMNGTGTYTITSSTKQDYYLIWYNTNPSAVSLQFTIDYLITGIIDFSSAYYHLDGITNTGSQSVSVPNAGDWYFYIYFDPTESAEISTIITFDVTFKTGVTATDKWTNARPTLIWIAVIIGGLIVLGVIARNVQKKNQQTTAPAGTSPSSPTPIVSSPSVPSTSTSIAPPVSITAPTTRVPPVSPSINTINVPSVSAASPASVRISACINCGAKLDENAEFCSSCGKKREGRAFGEAPSPPKIQSKYCYYCGEEIRDAAKFCVTCGAKTE